MAVQQFKLQYIIMLNTCRTKLPANMANYPPQDSNIEPATHFPHPPTPDFDTPTEKYWQAREPQQEEAEQLSRAGNETEEFQPTSDDPDSGKEGVIIMQGDVATTETIGTYCKCCTGHCHSSGCWAVSYSLSCLLHLLTISLRYA
jgi:hypothetical protein